MIDSIGIVGFLILLYTVYLIISEGSKKVDTSADDTDNSNKNEEVVKKQDKPKQYDNQSQQNKPKNTKSVPVQTIESDPDTLVQGKTYSEQSSAQEVVCQQPAQQEAIQQLVPTTTKPVDDVVTNSNIGVEMVSVKCPYCDNNVLVPKGGSAECSCCTSILNDNGNIVD